MSTTGRLALVTFLTCPTKCGLMSHRMADEEILHLAAAIDEYRGWILFQKLDGFPGLQVFHNCKSTMHSKPRLCRMVWAI